MIEAKKLAYADMLRYVADPKFGESRLICCSTSLRPKPARA